MGRKRHNYEFHEARELVRGESLSSRPQFVKWHKMNKPARIPKRPDRAYKDDFRGWNDFLGNNNPFPCYRRKFRPFKEARQYAHSLKLKNKTSWLEFAKNGNKPADVPSRPDVYYQKSGEWFTWKDFLGYDITDRIKSLQESEQILFILRYPGYPANVYRFGVNNGGLSEIRQRQQKDKFEIIRVYKCYGEFNWLTLVQRTTSPYVQSDIPNMFIVPNIFETINDLSFTQYLELMN